MIYLHRPSAMLDRYTFAISLEHVNGAEPGVNAIGGSTEGRSTPSKRIFLEARNAGTSAVMQGIDVGNDRAYS